MTFRDDVAAFRRRMEQRTRAVHLAVTQRAFESIVNGSPLTGAPGQPVDTGNLRTSWQQLIDGPYRSRIVTNAVYAPDIEDGVRRGEVRGVGEGDALDPVKAPDTPLTLRSQVGGFHSVKLTRANFGRLVADAVDEVTHGS